MGVFVEMVGIFAGGRCCKNPERMAEAAVLRTGDDTALALVGSDKWAGSGKNAAEIIRDTLFTSHVIY